MVECSVHDMNTGDAVIEALVRFQTLPRVGEVISDGAGGWRVTEVIHSTEDGCAALYVEVI